MDNCTMVTKYLLKKLNIKYSNQFIEDKIQSHPDHPNLLCISDTLVNYNIETLAIKINEEKLEKLPMPCIIQFSDQGGQFYVLEQYSEQNIVYLNDKSQPISLEKAKFLKRWTGVCLLVNINEESGEPQIKKTLANKRAISAIKWAFVMLFLIWIVFTMIKSQSGNGIGVWSIILYVLTKLTGLAMGFMLLWYEVDRYNPSIQAFCSGGKKANCDSVLNSKYAKLFNGQLSLALVSFAYFFGTVSHLTAYKFSSVSLLPLAYLSYTTLPIILLSWYYQGIVIKQWCRFCIITQLVLIVEIILAFLNNFHQGDIDLEAVLSLLILSILPIIAWKYLKPLLEAQKDLNVYKRGLKKIKNNPGVFKQLLLKSRKIKTGFNDLGISIINKDAKYDIIKVCNPYCEPCAVAHPILEKLANHGKINLQILFTASTEPNDIRAIPVNHFLTINALGDRQKMKQALDDWYMAPKKNYEVFAKKHPLEGKLKMQYREITAMYNWCKSENITHTPTLFINGHEIPKEYNIEDLSEILT